MQIFANGLVNGFAIAILALAFTSVYMPTRIFFVALGAIYALTPFIVFTCNQMNFPWQISIILALGCATCLSVLCEVLNHSRLENKNASPAAHMISSLAIYIIVVQAIAMIWGNEPKLLQKGLQPTLTFLSVMFTQAQIITVVVGIIVLTGFYGWLVFSKLGLQMRALADNPVELALYGYNVRMLRIISFSMAGFLCGISSLLVAYDIGFDPQGGLATLLLAVVAMIVGGRNSFAGPVLGGIILGVTRSEVVWFLSARWQEAVTFLLLALFLFFRPNGLLSPKTRLEAVE